MPTSLKTATFNAQDQDYTILATHDYEAPIGKTFDLTKFQFDSSGNKEIKPGSVISQIVGSNLVRVLPLTTVGAALAATNTTVTVADASLFALGEALVIPRAYATLTFGGTVATGNTVSLILAGQTYTYTLTSGDTTTALAAISFSAFINAIATGVPDKVLAIPNGAVVHFFSKTQSSHSFATAVTGGGITSTASAAIMQENTVIASISGSAAPNTTTNVITLAAGSAIALPIGAPIGVLTPYTSLLGITVKRQLVASNQALLKGLSNDIPVYWEADVYLNLLPYWDKAIAQTLASIHTV